MLAFAFLATFGFNGLVDALLRQDPPRRHPVGPVLALQPRRARRRLHLLPDPADADRLPAVARRPPPGVVRRVGEPRRRILVVLAARRRSDPRAGFLGALLLLFTNAFSAYATAAALISQGAPLVTLQIADAMQSEVVLGQENVGKALALGMIVIVSRRDGPLRPHPATRVAVGAMTASPGGPLSAAAPDGGALVARAEGRADAAADPALQLGARIAILVAGPRLPDPAAVRDARVLDARRLRQPDPGRVRRDPRQPERHRRRHRRRSRSRR